MTALKRSLISHLIISISLYVFFALLDIFFTLKGVHGDIAIEGNPIMRYMMANFGLMGGLVVEKSLVLLFATTVAIASFIGIEKEADWVYYLAFTRVTRNWMKRKKRY
jgi:NAD-dependent oxidoreductase involved in siderophore biosynthesis